MFYSLLRPALSRLGLRQATIRQFAVAAENPIAAAAATSYSEKYHDKLTAKANSLGYASIDEMRKAKIGETLYTDLAEDLSEAQAKLIEEAARKRAKELSIAADAPSHIKPLKSFLTDIEKFSTLTPKEIEEAWISYNVKSNSVAVVIPRDSYLVFEARSRAYPTTVLPLISQQDTREVYYLEQAPRQTFFTTLEEFRLKGSDARVAIAVTYYLDFVTTHNIVLARGEFTKDIVGLQDSGHLIALMRDMYLKDTLFTHVKKMRDDPNSFNFSALCQEIYSSCKS